MGNFLDYVNKKKKEEDEKKSSSAPKKVGNFGKYVMGQKIGLDTLESDLKSMGKTITKIRDGWQTEETMNNTRSAVESMYNRLTSFQDYQKQFGGGADVTDLVNSYKSVLDGWDDRTKLYGGFKNADAYNVQKKQWDLGEQFKGLSYDDVQTELKKYKPDSDEYKFLSTYTGYENLEDFDKAIKNHTPTQEENALATLKAEKDAYLKEYKEKGGYIPSASNYNRPAYSQIGDYHEYQNKIAEYDKQIAELEGKVYLPKLETARNKWALDNTFDLYDHYLESEDYEEKSQYWDGHSWSAGNFTSAKSAASKDDSIVYNKENETYYVYSDPLYEYVNNKNDARKYLTQGVVQGEVLGQEYSDKGYDELYPEEIGVFNLIDATEGREKALAYKILSEHTCRLRL